MSSDLMKEDLIKGLLDIFSGDIEAIILVIPSASSLPWLESPRLF